MTEISRVEPPINKKDLLSRLSDIIHHGPYEMPAKRYTGTGGPGLYLEDLLGLTTGNRDVPDTLGWELKFYSPETNLITLFHKEPKPEGIMRYMVSKFGWKDDQGRLSFRHTISGKSAKFRVDGDANQVIVRPIKGNGSVPYWTNDDIISAAGAKLRRLVLVKGKKKGQQVTYTRVDCFEDLQLSFFVYEVVNGTVKIDFDVREAKAGSKGLRNHGTKFRIAPDEVCRIYAKKERIS